MSFSQEWAAISAGVSGLRSTAELYSGEFDQKDTYGAYHHLASMCRSSCYAILAFAGRHKAALPPFAVAKIEDFQEAFCRLKEPYDRRKTMTAVIMLGAIETEVSFLLKDRDQSLRSRTERAFMHLNRLLSVDVGYRQKWLDAFTSTKIGETECEKLGATHLLWHGIMAFKAHGARGRTDLVFGEPLEEPDHRAFEGLVLTEWKVADESNYAEMFTRAFVQAKEYEAGVLSGAELHGVRYLVVVTQRDILPGDLPGDVMDHDIRYRHINVAIERRNPSEISKMS
ncbi:hypothetical protein GR223_05320 [Rhizobium leguminosarum]|uniref:hypothetical protein n=1 Tax=Rhizobium ruizarguesonis TaxID=2081791 RepID=UPI0013E02731|nr:hypothetical protein [Rhizobium ruizarguesonis]NEJ85372.1 hypothetical protein [Rhizobium ruizarguesonis]